MDSTVRNSQKLLLHPQVDLKLCRGYRDDQTKCGASWCNTQTRFGILDKINYVFQTHHPFPVNLMACNGYFSLSFLESKRYHKTFEEVWIFFQGDLTKVKYRSFH